MRVRLNRMDRQVAYIVDISHSEPPEVVTFEGRCYLLDERFRDGEGPTYKQVTYAIASECRMALETRKEESVGSGI